LHTSTFIFGDLAMVFAGALVFGLLFWRLRQPLILGYVFAGLILSPFTPGPRVGDVQTFQVMAEVGVILLMFSAGIEFSVPELLRAKWVALVGAPLGIALSIGLGVGVGLMLGWPVSQGLAVGCIISVASTMVLVSLLMDRGELASEHGRIMMTLTLVEDLAVVVLTVLLAGLGSGGASYGEVGWRVGKALLLLLPIVFASWKIMPWVLAHVEKACNDELSLLLALTTCLVVGAVTEAVGLSFALGAFVGGLLLGASDFAHKLAAKTLPIRDAFVAVFFVTIGMLIDPRAWRSEWRLLAVMTVLILAGKFAIWFGVVRLFGYPSQTAVRVGVGLTQIGEFSFVLAEVSRRSGLIGADVYNATLAASLVTILLNATLVKLIRPIAPAPIKDTFQTAS
jgi:monovalent cation:H+ antiporter-2, CPA2 family